MVPVSKKKTPPAPGNCKMSDYLAKHKFYVHWVAGSIFHFLHTIGFNPVSIHILELSLECSLETICYQSNVSVPILSFSHLDDLSIK